jgi:ABC-2 type transport system permease protein
MRKYLFIFKATLMESLQYIMNILLGFISFFLLLFIFMNLWSYIYSDPSELINGYSMKQMIWYVIITEIIWFGSRNLTLTTQISNDIKTGTIAYGINKPYHYIAFIIAKHLGEIAIKLILFAGAGLLVGLLTIGNIPGLRLSHVPLILLSLFLGIMINSFLRMAISVLSFWVEDCIPFHWIYDKLLIVIGTLFPVEVFPLWAQPLIRCSPIFVVSYGTAKLVVDYSQSMALYVLAAQVIYFILSLILLLLLYRKGVKRLNVNGG